MVLAAIRVTRKPQRCRHARRPGFRRSKKPSLPFVQLRQYRCIALPQLSEKSSSIIPKATTRQDRRESPPPHCRPRTNSSYCLTSAKPCSRGRARHPQTREGSGDRQPDERLRRRTLDRRNDPLRHRRHRDDASRADAARPAQSGACRRSPVHPRRERAGRARWRADARSRPRRRGGTHHGRHRCFARPARASRLDHGAFAAGPTPGAASAGGVPGLRRFRHRAGDDHSPSCPRCQGGGGRGGGAGSAMAMRVRRAAQSRARNLGRFGARRAPQFGVAPASFLGCAAFSHRRRKSRTCWKGAGARGRLNPWPARFAQ